MVSAFTSLLSITFLLVGTAFLVAAAVGVLRFSDALQRMHASTKAGTVGAAFIVLGMAVAHGQTDATIISIVAILFLLLTVPIAGHLLGRATYVSGAELNLKARNALEGHLNRYRSPLERRTEFELSPFFSNKAPDSGTGLPSREQALTDVRFALIAPEVDSVVQRALGIAIRWKVPLNAIAVIDERFVEASRSPNTTRGMVRERVASAVTRLHKILPSDMEDFSLLFEEGDPIKLIAGELPGSLLVLPPRGWCHHGVDVLTPLATGRPEGLLRLADFHPGPVLYVGEKTLPETGARLALIDDGSDALVFGLAWAVKTELWANPRVSLVGTPPGKRLRKIEEALEETGKVFALDVLPQGSPGLPLLPASASGFDVLVTATLPRPRRTDWYGLFWHKQIAKGWHGEVFVVPDISPDP